MGVHHPAVETAGYKMIDVFPLLALFNVIIKMSSKYPIFTVILWCLLNFFFPFFKRIIYEKH
jgi:hypothetical protein